MLQGLAARTAAPFFTIGVTTFNRPELLKLTLESISAQTFHDYEVIVGNDYVPQTLTAATVGVRDRNIRFVNHPRNLGEVANMNALLAAGRGRYFTWLSDDDLYAPNFLEALHAALEKFDYPAAAFSSFQVGRGAVRSARAAVRPGGEELLSGRRFLRKYLRGDLKIIGPYGVFRTDFLRRMGGVENLSDAPIGLYGEYIFLVRCGLLETVVFVDAPLVLYRVVADSGGVWANTSLEQYKVAGINLVSESVAVLSRPELNGDFFKNLSSLLKVPLSGLFVSKLAARDGYVDWREALAYLSALKEQFGRLRGSPQYRLALVALTGAGLHLAVDIAASNVKSGLKRSAPPGLVAHVRKARQLLARHVRPDTHGLD